MSNILAPSGLAGAYASASVQVINLPFVCDQAQFNNNTAGQIVTIKFNDDPTGFTINGIGVMGPFFDMHLKRFTIMGGGTGTWSAVVLLNRAIPVVD